MSAAEIVQEPHTEREPSSERLVRLRDCDAFGHLHNSRYIEYFMEEREDHLRSFYGFDVYEHALATGQGWLVTSNQIRYFEPAAFNERVHVVTRLFDATEKQLQVEGRMYGLQNKRLKAAFWTTFRAVDMQTGRPREHVERVMQLCTQIEFPFESEMTFEQRSANLQRTRTP